MRKNKTFASSLRLAVMASMTKKPRTTFQDLDTIQEKFLQRKPMNRKKSFINFFKIQAIFSWTS